MGMTKEAQHLIYEVVLQCLGLKLVCGLPNISVMAMGTIKGAWHLI